MAEEEKPSLHIDTDWKKQAQEEKRRLAEEEQKRTAAREERERAAAPIPPIPGAAPPTTGIGGGPASSGPGAAAGGTAGAAAARPARGRAGSPAARGERALPEASFATLVNSLVTQILLYLGDLTPRGVEPQVNLDVAKFNIDLLGVLEEKTRGNLTPEEQKLLDNALYEARMRYVSVASAYATV
jgi:hypothetical protein